MAKVVLREQFAEYTKINGEITGMDEHSLKNEVGEENRPQKLPSDCEHTTCSHTVTSLYP